MEFSLSQNSIDISDIVLLSLILPLLGGLILQLFWSNNTLSTALSVLLSFGSLSVVLMAVYFIGTTSSKLGQALLMLILGMFLLFSAITLVIKRASS